MPLSPPGLFPAVGLHSLGEEVRLHLPPPGPPEDEGGAMLVDSLEEEWGRLHDVRLYGSVRTRKPAGFGGIGDGETAGLEPAQDWGWPREVARELRMRVWGWKRLYSLPGVGGQKLRLWGEKNWALGIWVRMVLEMGQEGSPVPWRVKTGDGVRGSQQPHWESGGSWVSLKSHVRAPPEPL